MPAVGVGAVMWGLESSRDDFVKELEPKCNPRISRPQMGGNGDWIWE